MFCRALRHFILLVLLPGMSARAATVLDPGDSAVTEADYRALGSQFPAIGKVDTNITLVGSGVLIGDRWVLTAGHAAPGVATSGTFRIMGTTYTASRIISHPDYTYSLSVRPHDLSLMELSTPVVGIDPVSLWRFPSPAGILGEEAIWVGTGLGGTGLTGQQASTGAAKRGFTNVVDYLGAFGLPATSFISDFDRPDGSENANSQSDPSPTALEGNVASGDSGGGVFIERGGARYLAGIISYRAGFDGSADSDYGDVSGATNLALYYDWIESETGIVPVPEPGGGVLIVSALLGMIGARRRCR